MFSTTTVEATKTAIRVAPTRPSVWRNSEVVGNLITTCGSWRARDFGRENIALVADRADQLLARAAVVELAAKPADLHIDRPVERVGLGPPRIFQQLVAREHPLRPLDEGAQQRKLAAGEVHHGALGRAQLVADQVKPPAGELAGGVQAVVAARLAPAAQHRPHPGQQFARIAG